MQVAAVPIQAIDTETIAKQAGGCGCLFLHNMCVSERVVVMGEEVVGVSKI